MTNFGVEIIVGATSRPHRVIGPVKARVGALTATGLAVVFES